MSKRPAFYADAESGIEAGAALPRQGPGPQMWIKLPGYNHIDVAAAAWKQNNGRPELESASLVRWMLQVLASEVPRRSCHPAHRGV